MAICHFSYKMLTRSKGHSAVGKAAYISGEKLYDKRLEKIFNHLKNSDLSYKEIILPINAPKRFLDREILWNEIEASEKRKDSQLARKIEVSLPRELTEEQNIRLVKEYIKNQFVSLGMIADLCIHRGHERDQLYAHIMLTTREVSEEGFGKKVVEWDKQPVLYKWREEWVNHANKHLAKAGLDIKIDHRSNKDRGIDLEPQNKIGPKDAKERLTYKALEHEDIARRNGERIFINPMIVINALEQYSRRYTYEDVIKFINTHTADKNQFKRVYNKVINFPALKRRLKLENREDLDLIAKIIKAKG